MVEDEQNAQEIDADDDATQSRRDTGCGTGIFVVGLVVVLGCAFLMNNWDTLPGYARVLAIVATVIGTIMMLPAILLLAMKLLVRYFMGKAARELSAAAKDMIELNKNLLGSEHRYRNADNDDLDDELRARYDQTQVVLQPHGFRHVGDIINETIEDLNMPSPVIRVMISDDGLICCGFYLLLDPNAEVTVRDEPITIDLESEFSDGTYVLTNNRSDRNLLTPSPTETRRLLPPDTSIEVLLATHRSELQKLFAAKSDLSAVPMSTLDDVMDMQKRLQQAKTAFRESIGYVDPEEVSRIVDQSTDEDVKSMKPMLLDAVERARDGERNKSRPTE